MERRSWRRHSIHGSDTIPPDVRLDRKKPSIQARSAEKRRAESAQSIAENRENVVFRLKSAFASLNLGVTTGSTFLSTTMKSLLGAISDEHLLNLRVNEQA